MEIGFQAFKHVFLLVCGRVGTDSMVCSRKNNQLVITSCYNDAGPTFSQRFLHLFAPRSEGSCSFFREGTMGGASGAILS